MADMTLRRLADGVEKTGPEGPVPEGFERVDKPGRPTFTPKRTALDVILNPQGTVEQAVSLPASFALTGGAGALAAKVLPQLGKFAAPLGRAAAEGIQRGVGSAIQGEGLGDILTKGGLGAATAGVTEGVMGLAGKVGSRLAGTTRFREMATAGAERSADFLKQARQATSDAFDAISARLLGGKIAVPSLSTGKLSPTKAIEELQKLTGPKWEIARDEIAAGLNMLDKTVTAGVQKAGDVWKAALPSKLFPPRAAPKPGMLDTGTARTVADVVTGAPISEGGEGGVPAGAYALGGMAGGGMPHLPIGTLLRGH